MIRLFLVLCLVLAASCSSRKSVAGTESAQRSDSISAISTVRADKSSIIYDLVSALCDSICIRMSADSVKSPAGTVYRPAVLIDIAKPELTREAVEISAETDSASQEITAISDSHSSKKIETDSETVAVAKPLPVAKTIIFSLCIVSVIMMLRCFFRHFRQK